MDVRMDQCRKAKEQSARTVVYKQGRDRDMTFFVGQSCMVISFQAELYITWYLISVCCSIILGCWVRLHMT